MSSLASLEAVVGLVGRWVVVVSFGTGVVISVGKGFQPMHRRLGLLFRISVLEIFGGQ